MEADGPDVKRPRLDTHYPPHSSVPPPPPARYHEPAPPPAAYPPNTLPPPPIQAHPPSVPGTPLGPRAPRALPEPVNFSQHPNPRPGNAPPVTIPSRSYSVDSLSRPPSNPNQPSPIDTRPRQLAASGPPEGPHQQPPPPPMDHGGHHPGAYPNHDPHMNGAAPAPYPPPASHHNPYNGPPPMGPTQAYHPSPYAQPGVYGQAADYVGAGRKRQVRAVQACNNCRNRKQKCDEARPCQFCRESGLKCEYKEVPPPKQDRTLHDIATKVSLLMENFASIPDRLDRIERQLRGHQNGEGTLTSPSDQFPATTPAVAEEAEGSTYDPVREKTSSEPPTTAAKALSGPKYSLPPEAAQAIGPKAAQVPDFFEAEITLPADHTTAAHTMLMDWSAMQPFFKDVIPGGTNYPREQEENRGLLKLYGRGEGEDLYDGAHGGSPAAEGTEDDVVSTPAPSPGTNSWGIGFTAPPTGADIHRSDPQHNWGGLNPDGTLKLDVRTVRRLHLSYLNHMHPLQPFLDKERLSSMVEKFIQRYSPDANNHNARSPFAVPETFPAVPLKRKRSNNGPISGPEPGTPPSRGNHIERTIGNAIVLLVLALGRICEHKTHLPGPLGGPNTVVGSSLQMPSMDSPPTTIKPSPASSHSTLASIPSPGIDGARLMSRRPSTEQLPTSDRREGAARNMDITPGLAYYAYAVEILGAVHGGNDLSHGQAGVLACLYMGQLARVLESWGWICYACRVCGVLIDKDKESLFPDAPEPDVSDSMDLRKVAPGVSSGVDRRKTNLIKFLYWTCLQLESDILAEMSHLRPSGISKDEERIGLPNQIFPELPLDPPEEMNWLYYSAQIQLRKILNRTHLALYSKQGRKKNFWAAIRDDMLEEQLQGWRVTLPSWLTWDDSDEPSDDINKARMRAKYYGARYIITRPILHWAIHTNPAPTFLMKQYGFTPADENDSPDPSENLVSDSLSKASWHKVMMASKRCVESAVQSTIAFDGIENANQRLIVTNIFGTAHAQFGNCLVLAAVRKSWMRDLIPHARVVGLVERTIRFLRRLVPISPTLRVDVAILENTLKCLNGEKSDPASVDASFGT
ncbi:hypothetical protein MPH_05075 [Macrophomina phaseolina MS6]|uniref:Zn(2)-C6 fungal-type domain-containing protein n=2 Tax=Macrophomina phaseolina TaxID=35725 RepID=K2RY53_MACPH|nr:hypothetical protein MPH_05075 [Macrophomina phaseolina MS6]KAH7064639.1 hypothetical protein B0J12DRAFT_693071 [Macrophomina phaseolina]